MLQTIVREQSDQGPYCLQYRLPKYIWQMREQKTKAVTGGTIVNHMTELLIIILPANFVCGGYTVFTLSVRPSVRPSVKLCFLNNLKSHGWIFIKPCKHVHICKTNTLNKKVRARGQFY